MFYIFFKAELNITLCIKDKEWKIYQFSDIA